MIAVQEFSGKAVGVFGLARSGLSAARALKAGGAKLFAWDDNETARQAAAKENIALEPRDRWPWPQIKTLVLSPGIPLTHPEPHPVVRQAQNAGAEVIGDVELFARVIRSGHEANGAARDHRRDRHERKIHHHRADRSYPPGCGPRCASRRQYRQARARSWARRRPRPSMCSRCRPIRSSCRRALPPMWPCSPISRPITSTATARWRTTRRSRNRCSSARRPTVTSRSASTMTIPPRSIPSSLPTAWRTRWPSRSARCSAAASSSSTENCTTPGTSRRRRSAI